MGAINKLLELALGCRSSFHLRTGQSDHQLSHAGPAQAAQFPFALLRIQ